MYSPLKSSRVDWSVLDVSAVVEMSQSESASGADAEVLPWIPFFGSGSWAVEGWRIEENIQFL